MGLKPTTSTLRVRRASHCTTPPLVKHHVHKIYLRCISEPEERKPDIIEAAKQGNIMAKQKPVFLLVTPYTLLSGLSTTCEMLLK